MQTWELSFLNSVIVTAIALLLLLVLALPASYVLDQDLILKEENF